MRRSAIATLASLILLCAALFGTASVLRGVSSSVSLMSVVNTDDGVSLDESVIDDLRPSALQDAPSSPFGTDQLPPSAWPAWHLAGGT